MKPGEHQRRVIRGRASIEPLHVNPRDRHGMAWLVAVSLSLGFIAWFLWKWWTQQ